MQRRAAAIYVVFFVVIAIGAFSLLTVAEEPDVSVEGENYSSGDTLDIGDQAWTVNVSEGSGELSRVNESVRFTTSFANNSTLLFRNGTYRPAPDGSGGGGAAGTTSPGANGTTDTNASSTGDANDSAGTRFRVVIANPSGGNTSAGNASAGNASAGSTTTGNASANASAGNESAGNASGTDTSAANVTSFTLRETFAIEDLLAADPNVTDATLTDANGTRFVRYQNGTIQPLDGYLPPRETRNVSVGDSFPYRNNSTTVVGVNTSGVTLAQEGNRTETIELPAQENVTVGNTTYVPGFPSDDVLSLSADPAGFQDQQDAVTEFNDRILGLWGIVVLSMLTAILLTGLAYLPVRG